MPKSQPNPYITLGLLAIIWGSSFILMKEGLKFYSSYQIAAMRISFSGLALIPFVNWKKLDIKRSDYKYFIISGFLGSAIPAFLFPLAQTRISSSLAGAINGLTPLFALIVGVIFLGVKFSRLKAFGVIFGLTGAVFLIIGQDIQFEFSHVMMAIVATLCYGINVNIIKQKLDSYPPLLVAALPLAIISIAGFAVLGYLGLNININDMQFIYSFGATLLLAFIGTSISLIMFNRLIQQTNTVFATSVTYLIPIVALFWGLFDHEQILYNHFIGLVFILGAIWMIRKDK
ncbi:MAG: DMT family transporter [Bacteroidota bacterium]|jgi:drug/metabolite transporter (DMT)-like permease